ncbi:MAG: nuclear transport factor 2 family protein [Proteobacteria bacterium]|nr:nuclear transport factor 2 family protein [Pseudomonadota bacterium]
MSSSQSHADRLRKAYQVWNDTKGGNLDMWLDLMSPTVRYKSVGGGPKVDAFASPRDSKEEVREHLTALVKNWELIYFTVLDTVSEGEKVVVLSEMAWRNRATGKRIDTPHIGLFTFENGKVVTYYETFDTHRMIQAATP